MARPLCLISSRPVELWAYKWMRTRWSICEMRPCRCGNNWTVRCVMVWCIITSCASASSPCRNSGLLAACSNHPSACLDRDRSHEHSCLELHMIDPTAQGTLQAIHTELAANSRVSGLLSEYLCTQQWKVAQARLHRLDRRDARAIFGHAPYGPGVDEQALQVGTVCRCGYGAVPCACWSHVHFTGDEHSRGRVVHDSGQPPPRSLPLRTRVTQVACWST